MKRADMKVGMEVAYLKNPKGDLWDKRPSKVIVVALTDGKTSRSDANAVRVRYVAKPEDTHGWVVRLSQLLPNYDAAVRVHAEESKAATTLLHENKARGDAREARKLALMRRVAALLPEAVVGDYPRVRLRGAVVVDNRWGVECVEVDVGLLERLLAAVESARDFVGECDGPGGDYHDVCGRRAVPAKCPACLLRFRDPQAPPQEARRD